MQSFSHTCTYCLTGAVLPAAPELHSDLGDFSDKVCHVMKITAAESNPGMIL